MKQLKTTVIGFVGTTLDQGSKADRWTRWRPTISLLMHDDLIVDELILLHDRRNAGLVEKLKNDVQQVSPHTVVRGQLFSIRDMWDFADVYSALYDFVRSSSFDTANHQYFLHITTGTHVAQICWYLLIDAHYLPAKIIQSSPNKNKTPEGEYRIIDLDLSRYDAIKHRFEQEKTEHWQKLKSQIATQNQSFNQMIEEVELVATRSKSPILLIGATGVGKSQLAKQIFKLKKEKHVLVGNFVDVNCAVLRGDSAMSALFGHVKGAFTGAVNHRAGLLKTADNGMLFLDEIGELGLDEQAMLLKALEEKHFLPVGSDQEIQVDFQLIAGTNKDLRQEVKAGRFREDLWARLNTWTFFLPSLKDRLEDIAPNLTFELKRFEQEQQIQLSFYPDALDYYLAFAKSEQAEWRGNFRDLTASVTRMATLSAQGRITLLQVKKEIERLKQLWQQNHQQSDLLQYLTPEQLEQIDEFDQIQLQGVIRICQQCKSMAEAGRKLFAISRAQRNSTNDSDRVKKYLARFNLIWQDLQ